MSNSSMMGNRRSPGVPTLPKGRQIAAYNSYLEAQRAVDFLSDEHFAVQHVTIVGTDLRMVERVTGRLTYGRVALAGAASGAWFGLFVGLLLSLFAEGTSSFGAVLPALLIGAGFGVLFGVISYALTGGRRDFTSTSQIVASQYGVLCADEHAAEATEVLARLPRPGGGQGPQQPVAAAPPPHQPSQQQPSAEQPTTGATAATAAPTGPTYGEMMEKQKRERAEREERQQDDDG
jgi:hypothetical protein